MAEAAAVFGLLVHSAEEIVIICSNGERFLTGSCMNEVAVLRRNREDGVSIVVDRDGKIVDLGADDEIREKFKDATFENTIDATGKCVLPGLIDGHTHPVWAGDRVHEFAMKLSGASYMDIHRAGGGIQFTVDHTRKATDDELYTLLEDRLLAMLRCGTTTAECKSGYGLDAQSELKLLRVLQRAKQRLPIEISVTFCGAHAVPKGKTAAEATEDVLENQLPAVHRLMKSGQLDVENIDVFCEDGVFDVDQTRKILKTGQQLGLRINFHGDELHPMLSAEMGAELNATAISHLEEISGEGIRAMAEKKSVAVVLPTTAYILRLKPPPVRRMIEEGVPVALGTDFNPNAHCLSMPLAMHLACIYLHMSMNEALVAATLNAAASIGRSKTHGSLEPGKFADLVIIKASRWEHLIYQLGNHDRLISHVVKRGRVVFSRQI